MLGAKMVTEQTGSEGLEVKAVGVAEQVRVLDEMYIAFLQDRSSSTGLSILISTSGGSNVESGAKAMISIPIPPLENLNDHVAAEVVDTLGIDELQGEYSPLRGEAIDQLKRMYKMFVDLDCTLLEINPWAVIRSTDSDDNELYMSALDCKVTIDDSALWRQSELRHKREVLDAKMGIHQNPEEIALERGINYIDMKGEGDIGCIVNGAGLAMATMDLIDLKNGKCANFMDISGKVGLEEIDLGFLLLAQNPKVKVIFINIFGGIVDCQKVALGLMTSLHEIELS